MQSLNTTNLLKKILVPFVLSLYGAAAVAQEAPPVSSPESQEDATRPLPDQEVEVNEDNYRQFMELKDGLRQRTVMPEESFESRSGAQKLDKLPEESQKHLRNQLREVIVQGDRWQPGDENVDHPLVPSEAARSNSALRQQEAEAWGELLDNYHAREAQIHANSARSRAASAASGGLGNTEGSETGGEGESSTQAGQESDSPDSRGNSESGSYSPASQADSSRQNTNGVAQSAMEFLQNAGYQAGSGQTAAESASKGTGNGQDGTQQLTRAQPGNESANSQAEASAGAQGSSSDQADQGVAQNAMQYLQQSGQQETSSSDGGASEVGGEGDSGQNNAGEQADSQQETGQVAAQDSSLQSTVGQDRETDTEGVSQNALEYLTGESQSAEPETADTLSIEDLFNARGVTSGSGTVDGSQDPDGPPQELPDKPNKGGG